MTSSPWIGLADSSAETDDLASAVRSLVERVSGLVDDIADPSVAEGEQVDQAVRRATAAEMSAASARLRHAALALQVMAAGLADEQKVHHHDAERTTRTWVARHNGVSPRDAGLLCRAAVTRKRYPLVDRAFVDGEMTLGHLNAIGDIIPDRFRGATLDHAIEAVTDIQPTLVEAAAEHTVDDFSKLCARVRDRLDSDGPADRSGDPSRVYLNKLFNGRYSLSGDLNADDGALIATILSDALARDDAAAEFKKVEQPEQADQADQAEQPERPLQSERQSSALLALLLAGAGAKQPGRVGVIVHVDLSLLNLPEIPDLADLLHPEASAHTEAGLDISEESLWALLADADVTPVFNRNGTPLSYGRTHRLAPDMLKRVIAHRDRRCRFTGCTVAPNRTQAHHIVHWEHDGETDPKTCCSACSYHHKGHHRKGYRISGDANGKLTVTRPDGDEVDARPRYRDDLFRERQETDDLIRDRARALAGSLQKGSLRKGAL